MATTIPATIERIKAALDAHFDGKGFAWKTRESQSEHEQAKPTVYAMTCAQRTGDNWPTVCPSVTIELRGAVVENTDRIMLDIACHCVVVNSAILEREKTVMLDDGLHYAYLDEDGYTDEGVVEALFSDCLLLGEETLNALRSIAGVSNVRLVPPDTMDDFPHCQCQVTATVTALTRYIPDIPDDLL